MSTATSSTSPTLDVRSRVATLSLNRTEHANRLNPDDLATLRSHIESVNQDEKILVLRLVSRGKYFCSGYDISSLADADAPGSLYFGETVDAIERARPVTIAAIQGGVYGGGTDLCLACDFRIGVRAANMFMPATRLGLHFYPGGLHRYVSRLGLDVSKRLFLSAEKLDSQEMLRIGFLTELVDDDQLEGRLDALTTTLMSMAPIPLIGVKKHLNLIAKGELCLEEVERQVRLSEQSNDIIEGAKAWSEKRAPNFRGN